jgi:hypothetical protein
MTTNKEPSAARTPLGDFAPKLVDLTDDVLFGDLAFYVGWPSAMPAVNRAKALFATKEGT